MDDCELEVVLRVVEGCNQLTNDQLERLKKRAIVDCYYDAINDNIREYYIMGFTDEICCMEYDINTGKAKILRFEGK